MSVQAIAWALEQQVIKDSGARFVLLAIANHAGEDGCHAFPSVATMARYTGLSERTVVRKIGILKEAGVLVEGNQAIAAAHIARSDRRPVVYDICSIDRGVTPSPGGERGDTDAEAGCHSDANGVTPVQERGDTVTPEPSLNRSLSRPLNLEGNSPDGEPAKGKSKKKRSHPMPDDFGPDDSHREKANNFGLDLEHEVEQFTNFHLSKGSAFVDWGRALHTWLGNANKFAKQPGRKLPPQRGFDDMDYRAGLSKDENGRYRA